MHGLKGLFRPLKAARGIFIMEHKKSNTVFWLKGLLWLFAVMFLFTIVSKAANSLTMARVSVTSPSARKLQYIVNIEGRIGKNREVPVLSQPDILVKSIFVNEGQRVDKNDMLARLDIADLCGQIKDLKDNIKILKLQNQALYNKVSQDKKRREKEISRAEKDYEYIREKNKKAVLQAENEFIKAREALRNYKNKRKQEGVTRASLKAAEEEKKKALMDLKELAKQEEKAAKRAVEDAKEADVTGKETEINNISIREFEKKLKKLYKLKKQKGRILAPRDGVITAVLVSVGQKTPDTSIFTMTDDRAGLKFAGQVLPEDAKYIKTGDEVTVSTADREEGGIEVTSFKMDESGEFMDIMAILPAKTFSIGETASIKVVQESAKYPCTIPVTAVYYDNGKSYVFIVQTEDTVLGKQEVARKMEVNVLEKNDVYAALDASALPDGSRIIADTDRYVEDGSRVRVMEE